MRITEILYWYVALAENTIFYGSAPACDHCHQLPDLIREKLAPKITLSSIKTEVYISCRPFKSGQAAVHYCEGKKHVARGEYRFLEVINVDLK